MIFEYNPTITGGFVYKVMEDPDVAVSLNLLDLSESEKHNLVKNILIVGTRDLECDINKKIMRARKSS